MLDGTTKILKKIVTDPDFREWGRIVTAYTIDENIKFGCDHGNHHWANVASIAENFAKQAGADRHEVMLAIVAGVLHDCGMICGEPNHAENGARIARPFLLTRFRCGDLLSKDDIEIICHAIKVHSGSTDIRNIVDAAVLFADKVDIGRHRVNSVNNDIQDGEYHVQTVAYSITQNTLEINYVTYPGFNAIAFFRGWPKAFQVPQQIADYLGKTLVFRIDGKIFDGSVL